MIIDTFGRPLAKPAGSDDEPSGGPQLERQQRIERDLTTRVVSLLEPVVGPDRVRVNVSARLDAQSEEETEEKWDPNGAVDPQPSGERRRGAAAPRRAGPGRLARQLARSGAGRHRGRSRPVGGTRCDADHPARDPRAERGAGRGHQRGPAAVTRLRDHQLRGQQGHAPHASPARRDRPALGGRPPRRRISRDRRTPMARPRTPTRARTPEEIQKIQSLVAAAVGLDAERGDQLTVENIPFEETPVEVAPTPAMWQRVGPQAYEGGRVLGIVALGALAFFMFVKPLMRRATVTAAPVETAALPEHQRAHGPRPRSGDGRAARCRRRREVRRADGCRC